MAGHRQGAPVGGQGLGELAVLARSEMAEVVAQVPVRPRDRAAADLGPLGRVELSILP